MRNAAKRYALPVGDSWRLDETYLKVRGQWVYLYRAVDRQAHARWIFSSSKRRDIAAAKRFFARATRRSKGNHPGRLRRLAPSGGQTGRKSARCRERVCVRSSKHLNNLN
ncbi:MAG: DDE-type integrase/transposase/recombinase [Verrucomicrobia bacterium]|nr:DDE-type integrase/transposase/recombinase [Verrucomicrobiota bacterium]